MPKQFRCCIPKCQTRSTIDNFLNFPLDYQLRQLWISSIPNFDDVVDHETLICTKHFDKSLLRLEKNRYLSNYPPVIFPSKSEPNTKKKLKNDDFYPFYMFHLQDRDEYPLTVGCTKMKIDDFIFNFWEIKAYYAEKLGYLMDYWQVQLSIREVFFYKLNTEDVGKIKGSIKIKDTMHLEVVLSGRTMDAFDLTWAVPPTLLITRWSQLKMLLYEFGVVDGRKMEDGLPTILL
ncbi:unnamed protein product [Acanthoscelides obtectus]|uniref:THAP-type domain-containing protein n=1 Tax=Acanthoscelides obtectus TaxID=200917 RepID=A0A9P0NT50_ACAOB|nr:unnamed protein product [Acanthoscelides obtectus]CAK1625831.1 hypothetical protein AOBTE_LOCUS3432 [Acanthoscelides obtectus]